MSLVRSLSPKVKKIYKARGIGAALAHNREKAAMHRKDKTILKELSNAKQS